MKNNFGKTILIAAALMLLPAISFAQTYEELCLRAMNQIEEGETETDVKAKREAFNKGIAYAEAAIKLDPNKPDGYMWRCGNVGRECQTRSMMEQNSAVGKMLDDIATILDKLNCTGYAAAWHALAEIYFRHPFKSTDAAVNYTRKAITCIPKGENWLQTYTLLAEMLYDRNWSADKRASAQKKDVEKFAKKYKSNFDKYAFFDGSLGVDYICPWSGKTIGAMSDRDEARALVAYAKGIYEHTANKSEYDTKYFKMLNEMISGWK